MAYDYPCPSQYQTPEECADICVFVPAIDNHGNFLHWKICCVGCDENSYCDEPIIGRHVYSKEDAVALMSRGDGVRTDCHPMDDLLGLQRTGVGNVEVTSAQTKQKVRPDDLRFGLIRVQNVADPDGYSAVRLDLSGDTKRIELGGWDVTFSRAPVLARDSGSSVSPHIHPSQLPMNRLSLWDKYRVATVVLPEPDGMKQYVVPVPESSAYLHAPYRYALLLSQTWQVLFLRDPIPDCAKDPSSKDSDCGCK